MAKLLKYALCFAFGCLVYRFFSEPEYPEYSTEIGLAL